MTRFACTSLMLSIISSLALAACELPTKLGNLSDSGPDTGTTAATTAESATDSATSDGTTGSAETGETTELTSTSGIETSAGTTAESSDTETPAPCALQDQAGCEAGFCMVHSGVAYDFPGCQEGIQFLGCTDPQDCATDELTLCREGSDEVYKLESGCIPDGFVECEPPPIAFCGSCEALDETECIAEPIDCQPIYGAPHVEVDGEMCVDFANQQFLRCIANGGACPPFIPTICAVGLPDQAYDSPSGCIPAGFEQCEGEGTPECL